MSDWINDHKGAGPWTFYPQINVWGYLNNPEWEDSPGAPVNHDDDYTQEPQPWDITVNRHY